LETDTIPSVAANTKYARVGNRHIAYQVVGYGPFDLVFLSDWVNHIEVQWEEPRNERFLRTLASFSRLILFNPRGVGASDPVPINETPTAEQWMDDLRTVMDAVNSERPALFGVGIGGVISILVCGDIPGAGSCPCPLQQHGEGHDCARLPVRHDTRILRGDGREAGGTLG